MLKFRVRKPEGWLKFNHFYDFYDFYDFLFELTRVLHIYFKIKGTALFYFENYFISRIVDLCHFTEGSLGLSVELCWSLEIM